MTFSILYKKFIFATLLITAWKVLKYGVFSGPYFPVLRLNTEKYGPEKTLYLDTFHAVWYSLYSTDENFKEVKD